MRSLGWTHEAFVAVGVGTGLAPQLIGASRVNALAIGSGVDGATAKIKGRTHQRLGHPRAVPGVLDQHRAVAVRLATELIDAVVDHELVTHRARRQVKVLRERARIGAVDAEGARGETARARVR